jgi:hypothetical protein
MWHFTCIGVCSVCCLAAFLFAGPPKKEIQAVVLFNVLGDAFLLLSRRCFFGQLVFCQRAGYGRLYHRKKISI